MYTVQGLIVFLCVRRGYAEAEIEAVFAKYDVDGDRVLDEGEQRKMQRDLEGQQVSIYIMCCCFHLGLFGPYSTLMAIVGPCLCAAGCTK